METGGEVRPTDGPGLDVPLLLDSLGAGLYLTDLQGRLTAINREGLRLLRRSGEDLVGEQMHYLVHGRDREGRPVPAQDCPLLRVVQTGVAARKDADVFWLPDGSPLDVTWLSAPLMTGQEVSGAVVVFFDATAQHAAAERTRAREVVQSAAAARLTLLGRASEAMSTLDPDEALRRLARLSLAREVDWCVVDSYEAGEVRRVAVAHLDPAEVASHRHDEPLPPLTTTSAGSLARALALGQQQVVTGAEEHALDDPLDRAQAALFEELGAAHVLVTPLATRQAGVLGAMTWVRLDRGLPFDEAEQFLAAELGRRAGLALENARRFGQQRQLAESLQRSLLTVLPEPDHLHITARYLPAASGAEVGGDWYDAFVLPDGATTLVIGDVVGHDLAAASLMGQVRNMLRAIAHDRGVPPSEVLTRLDETLDSLAVGVLATCLVGRIEQDAEHARAGLRLLRWSSAGHPPAAVVGEDGTVRLLDEETDVMLGVAPELPRHDHTVVLQPGDTLWLYTDGLVERADQSLDAGLARLRQALVAVSGLPLEQACDDLLARMLPGGHPDDVALIVVRAHPEQLPRPAEAGPAHT